VAVMPLDPYYAKLAPLLGHIIIEHGNLEGDAGRMLARLNGKGDDLSAAIYAAKRTFNEKITLARKLVEQQINERELKAEFCSVLDEMDRLNKIRNKYIHSEYLPEIDKDDNIVGAHYRQIKQMGDVIDINDPSSEIAVHRVDEREVRKVIEDMIALALRMRTVSEAYFDSLPYAPPGPPLP
jgi:hypothetical protein